MNNTSALCPLCRSGIKKTGITTFTVDFGFGVLVVRDVPAQVCKQCGSDWIEDNIAEKLESVVELARKKHPIIEVTNWDDKILAIS